ncbi:MAG: Putative membrane protein [uncultured Thiotrichaceae bacterium]|uniref:Membrane protein n=1 Tax=uncultured Thiotrichaceae bacterium TaxID=298394 RepID=A0A6S6SF06_9GAMM|nr:MAG: Putative membrane protein [uncultured Thiotrichaceae bacterium]
MVICTLLAMGLLQVIIFSLPATANWLIAGLEQQYPPQKDLWAQDKLPEAIVVLGAGRNRNAPEYDGESTSLTGIERLRYAALLHRKTGLPILLSGGQPLPNVRSEAELMHDVLVNEFKVPVRWLEKDSHTTWQNAELSNKILLAEGIQSAWLVTQAWHMPRSMMVFQSQSQNQGITYQAASVSFSSIIPWSDLYMKWVPQPTALTRSMIALHEWVGLLWYKLRQYQSH